MHIIGSGREYFKNHKVTEEIRSEFLNKLEEILEEIKPKSGKFNVTHAAGLRIYGGKMWDPSPENLFSKGTWMIGKNDQPMIDYEVSYARVSGVQWKVDWRANWKIRDNLNLRGEPTQTFFYKVIAFFLGGVWHDVLGGNDPAPVHIDWQESGSFVTQQPQGPSVPTAPTYAETPNSPKPTFIQRKLTVSHPEDESEREADRIADQVMRMPDPLSRSALQLSPLQIQRMCTEGEGDLQRKTDPGHAPVLEEEEGFLQAKCEASPNRVESNINRKCESYEEADEKKVQRKEAADGIASPSAAPVTVDQTLNSPGRPLDPIARSFMEERFDHNFSDVRVHTDDRARESARAVNALAYTVGRDVVFGQNQYAPHTTSGQQLLAHELTHVVQQDGAYVRDTARGDVVSRRPDSHPGTKSARIPSVDTIPSGGTPLDKVGIVAWDGSPRLRLRSSPSTADDNVISDLAFNTHVQAIKEFPGKWYFVSTQDGQLGYVSRDYIKTNLPEPNATLHKVEPGLPGFAISIAEQYYKRYADDWGQDLRFYVNVLAWVNKRPVPDTTAGWKEVNFKAGEFIWIPTHPFARSLKSVVNSGSISHNIADAIGIADFLDRVGELWDDIRTAIALSKKYLMPAIGRHVEAALIGVLESIAMMLILAAVVLAISTAIGAAIGSLAGGVGAAPGAAAGFEIGMVLLNWLGLGMLAIWVVQSMASVASAFGTFLGGVWNARGDVKKLELTAMQFAEAIGVLCGVLIEALVMWAVSIGATEALGALRGSRFGKSFNNSKTGTWLNERVRRVRSGETAIPTPKDTLARIVRNTELVDAKNSPVGEFDGIDMGSKKFVENKSATGLDKPTPRTGKPQQTPAQWAAKQVTKKTSARIKALTDAVGTRVKPGTTGAVPTLGEIQGFRHIHFLIDGDSPALKAAVFAELAILRANNSGWTFTVEFGVTVILPPMPGTGQPDE
jgi:hypothetical protein